MSTFVIEVCLWKIGFILVFYWCLTLAGNAQGRKPYSFTATEIHVNLAMMNMTTFSLRLLEEREKLVAMMEQEQAARSVQPHTGQS